jgi:hypothetical protein
MDETAADIIDTPNPSTCENYNLAESQRLRNAVLNFSLAAGKVSRPRYQAACFFYPNRFRR